MMLTIHGLPPKTSFQAVKTLIKQECNIIDFILDNLVDDGPNSKKVRIGVPDDTEGYRILKYLNGFRMSPTHLLKIVPVGKSLNPPPQQNYEQRPNYPEQRNDYPTQSRPEYQPPLENYNSGPDISKNIPNTQKPFMDTRKGNYVPPNMRPKKTGAPGSRDSGPLRPPEIRPHNLEQLHSQGPSGSHGSGPQASGSHVSGPLGSGPHGSRPHGSGPHGSGLHGSGPHGSGPHGSGPHGSGPHGSGPHGSGSHGPRPQGSGPLGVRPHSQDSRHPMGQGQQDMMNTPQWGSEMNSSNEWRPGPGNDQTQNYNQRPNQGGFGQQQQHMGPQDHYAQGRGSTGQGFGFQPKPNVPELVVPPQPQRDSRQHVLRAVDIVDTQAPARQYPPEKPITIMKDNFQGPQYSGPPSQHGNYAGQAQTQPVWQMNQQQKSQYDDRHPPMDKRSEVPKQDFDKRGQFVPITSSRPLSPRPGQDRSYQGSDRHMSPNRGFPERRVSPSRLGPPARELSPSGRRISPGRRYSPGRRMSPGRRFSPARKTSPGRKMSPGRRFSPGRKMSPGRRYSPGRKVSPGRRDDSRRMSPSMMQYDNYVEDERKFVRRDSPRRYSPGRGPSPSRRLLSPPRPRFSPNRLVDKSADKFLDDLKSSKPVRPAYEPPQAQNQSYTGGYRDTAPFSGRQESSWLNEKIIFPSSVKEDDRRDLARRLDKPADKSPGRQSRSPIKDRYRRHSPSPRSSRSPRRSWALEKRSPEPIREPPPPPLWPGQIADSKRKPTRFDPSTQETKHGNVWERLDETTPFQDKIRVRNDLEDIAPQRREFDDRRDHRDVMDRKQIDRDREVRKNDRNEFRRQSPRRDDRVATKNVLSDIDKDFQDIYKRAVEFRKKTEERQKSGERRREEYDDRHKVDDFRREASPRRSRSRERGEWHVKDRKRIFLSPTVKAKRDKAIDEITNRIIDKYDLGGDQKYRVTEELRITISNLLMDMFSDKDVSFIELVIKYQAKYPDKEEQKLMQDVLSRLPKQYRNLKRKAEGDSSKASAKSSRRSPPQVSREETERPKLSDAVIPEWNTGLAPPKVMNMSLSVTPAINMSAPGMVPSPVYLPNPLVTNTYAQQQLQLVNNPTQQPQFSGNTVQQQYVNPQQQYVNSQQQYIAPQQQYVENQQQYIDPQQQFAKNQQQIIDIQQSIDNQIYDPRMPKPSNEAYTLYLCQDDFEPFSTVQAEYLKKFIFNQIVKVTVTSNGWAPDIMLKGLQSSCRYEVSTNDARSKDWIINLNFAEFEYFNVLVYTKEELWYERAAIWLPGHSRVRAIEPLDKIKMQNRQLEKVSVSKWKFVKKIVNEKGMRLYVDMPPSSARALEKHKMMLSYELQKVNVFLKAVAVDKDVFDNGLKEMSITDSSVLTTAVQNSPMPTLNVNSEPGIVKIGINGQKNLSVNQARKIKEVVVYHLFKYLQQDGYTKTDFIKYGFCPPNFLGIVPANSESKKWLLSRNFGKIQRHNIVVFGDETENKKYIKMFAGIPIDYFTTLTYAFERLKQSNQGVKGIHFNLWKPIKLNTDRKNSSLEIDIDLESVEALSKMKYKLDYVDERGIETVTFHSQYSSSKLEEKIKKLKMEQVDSYDVANMELDSDSDKDDVISLN